VSFCLGSLLSFAQHFTSVKEGRKKRMHFLSRLCLLHLSIDTHIKRCVFAPFSKKGDGGRMRGRYVYIEYHILEMKSDDSGIKYDI